ncbi:sulfite exporter TauE/SafE family protein [Nocardioides sp.]|uniref:sulfite exporter TauE/SafE family protein n=1 Tax=Nocardioides sp. TaxID=35761 RepID=UPI0035146D65
MTWLVVLGFGLAIGLVLGGLGGGGAILTVPVLVFALDESAAAATTGSLVIVGLAAATGAIAHVRAGGVDWRTGLLLAGAGVPGAWLGAHLASVVDERVLLTGFAALMVLAGVMMAKPECGRRCRAARAAEAARDAAYRALTAPDTTPGTAPDTAPGATGATAVLAPPAATTRVSWRALLAVGTAIGFVTGFFGVGGGFVIVPALVLVLKVRIRLAVGTSLVVVALNALISLAARAATAEFDWAVILPFAAAAMAGTLLGRTVADRLPAPALRRGFALLLIAVAAYTAWQSLAGA